MVNHKPIRDLVGSLVSPTWCRRMPRACTRDQPGRGSPNPERPGHAGADVNLPGIGGRGPRPVSLAARCGHLAAFNCSTPWRDRRAGTVMLQC